MHAVDPDRPTANTPPLDEQGFIAAHAPCVKCNYELLGLKPDGACPECGTSVALSISVPLLRCISLPSLIRLRTGLRLILSGYICLVVAMAVGGLITLCIASVPQDAMNVCQTLISILLTAGTIVIVFNTLTNVGSDSSLARGLFTIVSLCLLASSATRLLAPLRSVEFTQEAILGTKIVHILSFGTVGAGLSCYIGNIIGVCGHNRLRVAGKCLALPFSCFAILGSLATTLPTSDEFGRPNWAVIGLSSAGLLAIAVGIVGVLIFLPLVLRVVSAEIKIARGWAKT